MQLRDTSDLRVPAARTIDLVTTESKDEVLVYDQAVHHIHHLNATAAKVWRLCDGERTVSEIAAEAGIAEDAVKLALRTLEDAQLLDAPLATTMRGTQSRRAFMKKAAIAGQIPAIVSITAPISAAAAGEHGVIHVQEATGLPELPADRAWQCCDRVRARSSGVNRDCTSTC